MNSVNNLRSRIGGATANKNGDAALLNETSSKGPVQVEPKTYFANERTFIQWISAALLLLTVSSVLMSGGNYNGTSSVIAFSSLVLVAYASFVYFRRVYLLRAGDAYGYLDFVGPSILAAGVGIGVFIVFADAIKGSEFLPFGSEGNKKEKDEDDRRVLLSPEMLPVHQQALPMRPIDTFLKEVEGTCTRHSINGVNLLEYQPRDILFHEDELIVATPQSLVSHSLSTHDESAKTLLSEIQDTDIQAMVNVGNNRLFALSTGPKQTELIEFNAAAGGYTEHHVRSIIKDSPSTAGSMVFVPSDSEGALYIYLDGTMHRYHVPVASKEDSSMIPLQTTGSINMKVLNQGQSNDPIVAMEHFEGLTYLLRETTMEAWDLASSKLLAEWPLPAVSRNDNWVGMTFHRRRTQSPLRKNKTTATVYMPLDSFPPQLWSFRLEEQDSMLTFPDCGVALN